MTEKPLAKLTIDTSDAQLHQRVTRQSEEPIEMFGVKWLLWNSRWSGIDRAGTVVLVEVRENAGG